MHIPVLLRETLATLDPKPGERFADGTLGGGGHAAAILDRIGPAGTLIGIDRDRDAIARFAERFPNRPNIRLIHASYAELPEFSGSSKLDGLLVDLGFSSDQVDDAARGLSFSHAGPLDMRYDRTKGFTAADAVNGMREDELADLIWRLGEDRNARRIAKAITDSRRHERIETTDVLARIVAEAVHGRGKIHPATKTFQALRIFVNDEFGELGKLLSSLPRLMAPGGRVAVITFHSAEDRIVKEAFRSLVSAKSALALTKKPIAPSRDEVSENPRSRSAKLRAIRFLP